MPAPKDPGKYIEWKRKLSLSHKGNPKCHPDGWSEKVSASLTGRVLSKEHRDNIRSAKIGSKYRQRTEEHCRKISMALSNKPKSEEHKRKLSESRKSLSLEAKRNIREAALLRFSNPDYIKIHNDANQKRKETLIGGFWYGNVRYQDGPQYCERWTADLRDRVRAYFGYRCFECGSLQHGRKHNVHHVHYNKKTCCDGSPHDMIPLCPECHSKTNFNRAFWEDHFTTMIYSSDPNGKCFFTKEEMRELTQSP